MERIKVKKVWLANGRRVWVVKFPDGWTHLNAHAASLREGHAYAMYYLHRIRSYSILVAGRFDRPTGEES